MTTRIAVFSDVHGNLMALEALCREIEAWSPDRVWFLGDAVLFGPDPGACMQLLREIAPDISIEGNTDRYVRADNLPGPSTAPLLVSGLAFARAALDDRDRQQLACYERDVKVSVEGVDFHLCHGAPGDDEVCLAPDADRTDVARRVAEAESAVVLCGHTHIPWDSTVGATRLINSGSVGFPFDGDVRGAWVALEVAAARLTHAGIRRFDFDRQETIRRVQALDEPGFARVVQRLSTARA